MGFLDVVAGVDGLDEGVEEEVEAPLVEGLHGIVVLTVGLAFLHRLVDEPLVVVAVGKLYDLCAHEDVALAQGSLEGDAFERGTTGEGDIGLSASEGAAASEVDGDLLEGESLTLVDGDGPCQTDGELGIGAEQLFLDLLFFLVEGVAHVLPHLAFDVVRLSVFGGDAYHSFFLGDVLDGAQCAVHPALVLVVLDEDDLCARLQLQFDGCGYGGLREVALDGAEEGGGVARQGRESLFVDVIDDVAAGGQRDLQLAVR